MKITFLGTNGWYDTATGNTLSVLIETKKEFIILDAGNGFYKIDRYIKSKKPIYLFISHFHLDHIIGLHTLNKFNFSQGINLYGPPDVKKYISTLVAAPYTASLAKLKTKIRIKQIKKESHLPFKVSFGKLYHPSFCYGYRFNLEGKVISYCTDTGICKNLYRLAKNSDMFITECSYLPGQKNNNWPHLTPEEAALAAKQSGAKKLVLTHFAPHCYINLKLRKKAQAVARPIFSNTYISTDGCSFTI